MFENLKRNLKDCFKRVEPEEPKVVSPPPPPPPMITIDVNGTYKIFVKEYSNNYHDAYNIFIEYDIVASFGLLGTTMIPIKDKIRLDPVDLGLRSGWCNSRDYIREEEAYQQILHMIQGDDEVLKEQLQQSIAYQLEDALRIKNIEELKKLVKNGTSFDLNMSFDMQKTERFK